mgnify:CR=1 FL=1
MVDKPNLLTAKILKKFAPLSRLNERQLVLLASHHEIKEYKKNATVITRGSSDNKEYFLIQGKLQLIAKDGKTMEIEGGSPAAMRPVAHLQPRQYDIQVLENGTLLLIDWFTLAQFIREAPKDRSKVKSTISNDPLELIRFDFYQDLERNHFSLPSIPVVARNIRDAMRDEAFSVEDMTKLINADPVMAVKIISASNSPIYRGTSKIELCADAVVRLGIETTKQLVDIYALRDLFNTKLGKLQRRMHVLWEHSQTVAVIAHTLAVIIAQIHAWLGSTNKPSHPPMDEITAFSKLERVGLTPEKSIALLTDAKEKIKEMRQLVGGEVNGSVANFLEVRPRFVTKRTLTHHNSLLLNTINFRFLDQYLQKILKINPS